MDFLKKHNFSDYLGIDINVDAIKISESKGHKAVFSDAFTFLKREKGFYDLIVLNDVLEHFDKFKGIELLKLVKKSLRKNGLVILRVPNANFPFSSHFRYTDFTHETIYEKNSLEYILKLCGFEVMVCRGFKMQPKNPFRKLILNFLLKLNQLFFIVYTGNKNPVDLNIFAIGNNH